MPTSKETLYYRFNRVDICIRNILMSNELHDAAADTKDGYKKVRTLVEYLKVDVNAPHSDYHTVPVEFAAQTGSLATLKYLIEEAKAACDASQLNYNLLYWAAHNTQDVIDYLVDPKNEFMKRFNDGTTAFHVAAMANQVEQLSHLLESEPDSLFKPDKRGDTALELAARLGNQTIVYRIITHPFFITSTVPHKYDSLYRGSAKRHITMGAECEDAECFEQAINYYREAIRLAEMVQNKQERDYLLLANALDKLGSAYFDEAKLDDAIKAFRRVVDYSDIISGDISGRALLKTANKQIRIIERKQALIREADSWGFDCQEIDGDGNCFFNAVREQCVANGISEYAQLSHEQLRAKTIEHLRKHSEEYLYFIDEEYDGNYEHYLEEMSRDGVWADDIAIRALSRALDLNIVIIRSDGALPNVFKRPNSFGVVHLGFEEEWHYVALRPQLRRVDKKNIVEVLVNAEFDLFSTPKDSLKRKSCDTEDHYIPQRPSKVQDTLFAMETSLAKDGSPNAPKADESLGDGNKDVTMSHYPKF